MMSLNKLGWRSSEEGNGTAEGEREQSSELNPLSLSCASPGPCQARPEASEAENWPRSAEST